MDGSSDLAGRETAGRDFVMTCYEIFLGRDLDFEGVADERGAWPKSEVLQSIFESDEFKNAVRRPLARSLPFAPSIFGRTPTVRQRLWAARNLPISSDTAAAMRSADGWRSFLTALLNDNSLVLAGGTEPLDAHRPLPSRQRARVDFAGRPVVLEDPFELWA